MLEGEIVRGEHTHVYRPPHYPRILLKESRAFRPLPDEMLIGLASAKETQCFQTKNKKNKKYVFSWARAAQQATKCMKELYELQ
mmetsp:Transcript_30852/g.56111  ORF Transcript_30852/g.56111 Transcript_30852/m.56111 type:complete len:84 (-) Transcript_30852:579-830(-)